MAENHKNLKCDWTIWDGNSENAPDDARDVQIAMRISKEVQIGWYSCAVDDSDQYDWIDRVGEVTLDVFAWRELHLEKYPEHLRSEN